MSTFTTIVGWVLFVIVAYLLLVNGTATIGIEKTSFSGITDVARTLQGR